MRSGEALALVYFGAIGALALVRMGRPGWLRSLALAAFGALVSLTAPMTPVLRSQGFGPIDLRDWWLLLALPLAYWAPAPLVTKPLERLEHWLGDVDRRLGVSTGDAAAPLLELAYLFVYPMVPAGLLAVAATGNRLALEAFWPAVLIAVLPCYGL